MQQKYSLEEAIQAPIIPDGSAGYIILGDCLDDLYRLLGLPEDRRIVVPQTPQIPYSPVMRFKLGPMIFLMDKNLLVYQIAVTKGYLGKTEDGVRVGMPLVDLQALWGNGTFQEEQNGVLWLADVHPATAFKIVRARDGVDRVIIILITDLRKKGTPENPFPRAGHAGIETKKRCVIKHPREMPMED